MRLLLWGLAAAALLATEPGKRLQRRAVDTFNALKDRAFVAETKEGEEQAKDDEETRDEDEDGIDQSKAAELVEKLNAKPSAPDDELKSA